MNYDNETFGALEEARKDIDDRSFIPLGAPEHPGDHLLLVFLGVCYPTRQGQDS